MKNPLYLAVLLGLAACGTPAKPDPRLATIQAQHQQLLAAQRESAAQEKDLELIRLGRTAEAQKRFGDLVQQSQANLTSVAQLDPARSQEPAQIELVSAAATKEAELLAAAKATVSYNAYQIKVAAKRQRTLDSLSQIINAAKH